MTTQIRIVRAVGPDLEMKINKELQELERKGATIGRIEVHADRQFAYIVYTAKKKPKPRSVLKELTTITNNSE